MIQKLIDGAYLVLAGGMAVILFNQNQMQRDMQAEVAKLKIVVGMIERKANP